MCKIGDMVWVTEIYRNIFGTDDAQCWVWQEATEEEVEKLRHRISNANDFIRRLKKKRILVEPVQSFGVEGDNFWLKFRTIRKNGKLLLEFFDVWDGKTTLTKEEVRQLPKKVKKMQKEYELDHDLYQGEGASYVSIDIGGEISLDIYTIEKLFKRLAYLRARTTFEF